MTGKKAVVLVMLPMVVGAAALAYFLGSARPSPKLGARAVVASSTARAVTSDDGTVKGSSWGSSRDYPTDQRGKQERAAAGDGGGIAHRDVGWYRGDLHFHSNYSDDALEQGGDWVGGALRIAEYYEDPTFQAAFPDHIGNQFDYVALTDHRTIEGTWDIDFKSDKLILVPGEEFGNTGHAGAWNITSVVSAEPAEGRTPTEQVQWAINNTRDQGGLFSANHPTADDDMWFWDVSGYEAAEVWNLWWSLMAVPTDESVLDQHVATYGAENRFIRRALRERDRGLGGQYLAFYEAHLTAGVPLAAVGGGDRHMVLMPGHPTTYIQAEEESAAGLIAGIRAQRTFVSRSPVGPQVLFTATAGGKTYGTGAVIPRGQTIQLQARVARAAQGILRVVSGPILPGLTQEQILALTTLEEILFEVPIPSADYTWQGSWTPTNDAWVFVQVLESADYSNLPADVQRDLDALTAAMESYGMRYGQLAFALLPLLDPKYLLWPGLCTPDKWDVYRTSCVDVDDAYMGTIYISEPVDRILNLYREHGQLTDYAMGAITSAIRVQGL